MSIQQNSSVPHFPLNLSLSIDVWFVFQPKKLNFNHQNRTGKWHLIDNFFSYIMFILIYLLEFIWFPVIPHTKSDPACICTHMMIRWCWRWWWQPLMVLMKVLMVLMEGSPDDLDALITHRVQDCSLVVHVVSPFWNNLKTGNCTDSSSCYRAALLYSGKVKNIR